MEKTFKAATVFKDHWIAVDLVALYIFGNLLGVFLEGIYCRIVHGHWETHVVSMIAPFCIIYGLGTVFYYLASGLVYDMSFMARFVIFGAVGTVFELICGMLLLHGLKMRAWDYTADFLNFKGVICPQMFFVWGALGLVFCHFTPKIAQLLSRLHKQPLNIIACVLAVLMTAELIFTFVCIARWKNRVYNIPARSGFEQMIDENYPNDYMQHRFIEWHFIDPEKNTVNAVEN